MNTDQTVSSKSNDAVNSEAGARFSKKMTQTGSVVLAIFILSLLVFGAYRLQTIATKLKTLESVADTKKEAVVEPDQGEEGNDDKLQATTKKYLVIARKLTSLALKVNQLSMNPQSAERVSDKPANLPPAKPPVAPPANAEMKWWRTVGEKLVTPVNNFFKDLIKIQVIDEAEKTPVGSIAMTPASQMLIKQELKLYVLSAKQLTLAGSPSDALADLAEAKILINKNFAIQSQSVINFIQAVSEIESDIKGLESSKPETINKAAGKK